MPKFHIPKTNIVMLFVTIILFVAILPSTYPWLLVPSASATPVSASLKKLADYQYPSSPKVIAAPIPKLFATSFIAIDTASNTILIAKNENSRIYPASTTKLATVLTALNVYPLDEVVTVTNPTTVGQIMHLQPGEKITVRSLVSALLIFSANDSAHALAQHYPQGESGFVDQMNIVMNKYHLNNTHFMNVDGIHDPLHYTSVYDLSQLGRLAIKNPIVRQLVQIKKTEVTNLDGTIHHSLVSTNELLDVAPEVKGLKTGWTPEANGCFVGLLEIKGHEVISVVANSSDRFGDTLQLITWLKANVFW